MLEAGVEERVLRFEAHALSGVISPSGTCLQPHQPVFEWIPWLNWEKKDASFGVDARDRTRICAKG